MISVLFVDDEQSLLDGLRRSLRSMRNEWDMRFANSGADALAMLDDAPADVIVSDMRMPKMDGMELLRLVRERAPQTIRIVLSGQTDMQDALRSASLAQVFLHKPCDPEDLKGAIERTTNLARELNNEELLRVVGAVDALPSPPYVVTELNRCLQEPETGMDEVAAIVAADTAVTAKLLQLANSAIFGGARNISTVEGAIQLLGIANVRDLAAASALFRLGPEKASRQHRLDQIEARTVRATQVAAVLVGSAGLRSSTLLTAVLLHDVGELVIAVGSPEEDDEIQARIAHGESRADAERGVLGVTTASVGAYLLSLWGIPHEVVEAAAWHRQDPPMRPWTLTPLHLSYLIQVLVTDHSNIDETLPERYVHSLGLEDQVAEALAFLEAN